MAKVFDTFKGEATDRPLDIHDYLVKHPTSTFFMKIENDGPEGTDINAGDILVVDRSLSGKKGSTVVLVYEGEFQLERLTGKKLAEEVTLWGVVVGLLRRFE